MVCGCQEKLTEELLLIEALALKGRQHDECDEQAEFAMASVIAKAGSPFTQSASGSSLRTRLIRAVITM